MAAPAHPKVLIVDFGSQVTQLIARRLRENGVYCEIWPYDKVAAAIAAGAPAAVILSGGPASAQDATSPVVDPAIFDLGVPVLGICYGEMTLCARLGGAVEGGHARNSAAPRSALSADLAPPGRVGRHQPPRSPSG